MLPVFSGFHTSSSDHDDSAGSLTYRARSCYNQIFPLSVNTMSRVPTGTPEKLVNDGEGFYILLRRSTHLPHGTIQVPNGGHINTSALKGTLGCTGVQTFVSTEPQKNIRFHGESQDVPVYDTDKHLRLKSARRF